MTRTHYYKGIPQSWYTSCGLHISKVEWTNDFDKVTCKNCIKCETEIVSMPYLV